jgi:L-ascorbate metabolism protein UlaG (beta-lactamase superfamily)
MPVSTYRIPLTMGEKGAVKAARDLRAGTVIPIHLGVQPRSPLLRTGQSPEGFEQRLREAGLHTEVVHLEDGDTWECTDLSRELAAAI